MRQKATALRSDATVLESSFNLLPERADAVEFHAHAGDRWRHNVRDAVRRAHRHATHARHLARRLDHAADHLDDDLKAWGKAQDDYAKARREASTQPPRTR
jgi:hypothetical protein